MKKNYKVYMITVEGKEVYLGDHYSTKDQAERKADIYRKQDAYERSIGYHVPTVSYIVK